MSTFKTIKSLIETLDGNKELQSGKFSYRIEYKNKKTGGVLTSDWQDIDLSDEGLLGADDIAYAVQHMVPGSNLDFIARHISDQFGFVGYPSSFNPVKYDVISNMHGVVKILVVYNLRDINGRGERDEPNREATVTFMEQ